MTAGKLRILFVDLSNVCRCARRLLYIHCSLQQCASLLIVGTTLHKFLAEIIPGRSFWWSQVAGLRGHLSQLGTEGGPPRPVHHQLMQHRRSAALRPSAVLQQQSPKIYAARHCHVRSMGDLEIRSAGTELLVVSHGPVHVPRSPSEASAMPGSRRQPAPPLRPFLPNSVSPSVPPSSSLAPFPNA